MTEYLPGVVVKFNDANATTRRPGEAVALAEGVVNGEPIEAEGRTLVPVWTQRKGREATTVYVDTRNIISEEREPRS